MANRKHVVLSCDKQSIGAPEILLYVHMSEPTRKQAVHWNDEESPHSYNKYTSDPLELPENVNHYGSKDHVLRQMKKEFPQYIDCRLSSEVSSDNKELLKGIERQEVKRENIDEGLLLYSNEEDDDIKYQFTLKAERLEDQEILNTSTNYEPKVMPQEEDSSPLRLDDQEILNTSTNYEAKVTPQEEDSSPLRLDDQEILNTSTNYEPKVTPQEEDSSLLRLDDQEILNTSTNYEAKVTPQEDDSSLLHSRDRFPEHVNENSLECKYCKTDFKYNYRLNEHIMICHPGIDAEEIEYNCDFCEHVYKSKYSLAVHVKRIHNIFHKEFRAPIDLNMNKKVQHNRKTIKRKCEHKCDQCGAVLKFRGTLVRHIRTLHCYDGVRRFECDYCKKDFTTKHTLIRHIKTFHSAYDKVYVCWCGKRYPSRKQLNKHKKRRHIYVHKGFKFIFS